MTGRQGGLLPANRSCNVRHHFERRNGAERCESAFVPPGRRRGRVTRRVRELYGGGGVRVSAEGSGGGKGRGKEVSAGGEEEGAVGEVAEQGQVVGGRLEVHHDLVPVGSSLHDAEALAEGAALPHRLSGGELHAGP